jgi:hypothetical protein
VRFVAVLLVGLALVLGGCGHVAVPRSSPSSSPSTNARHTVMRDLKAGERVTLANGLSLTVPAAYHGWYGSSSPALEGEFDVVASRLVAQTSLMDSFMARSIKAGRVSAGRGWPLIASSDDGTVEVHAQVIRAGTRKAVGMTSVIVRVPGHPLGEVSLMVFGKEASTQPEAVLAQAARLWQLFRVQGATLPSALSQ